MAGGAGTDAILAPVNDPTFEGVKIELLSGTTIVPLVTVVDFDPPNPSVKLQLATAGPDPAREAFTEVVPGEAVTLNARSGSYILQAIIRDGGGINTTRIKIDTFDPDADAVEDEARRPLTADPHHRVDVGATRGASSGARPRTVRTSRRSRKGRFMYIKRWAEPQTRRAAGVILLFAAVLHAAGCDWPFENEPVYEDPVVQLRVRVGEAVYEGPVIGNGNMRYWPALADPKFDGVEIELPPGTTIVPRVTVVDFRPPEPTVEIQLSSPNSDSSRETFETVAAGEPLTLRATSSFYRLSATVKDSGAIASSSIIIRIVDPNTNIGRDE